MNNRSLQLSEKFIKTLMRLPDKGIGCQIVKLIFKTGEVLHYNIVLNSEWLILAKNDIFTLDDIAGIKLES